MKYRTDLETASQVFSDRVYQHVGAFGCHDIVCHDSREERRVGWICREHDTWYNAPYPGPGQLNDWPWDMKNPKSATYRQEYLVEQVRRALAMRRPPDPPEKTAWDFVKDGPL